MERTLTKKIAQDYIKHPYSEGLGKFSLIADDAVDILLAGDGGLDLHSIKTLSDAVAGKLSAYKGNIILGGLMTLSDSPGHLALATKLGKRWGGDMRGLKFISAQAASLISAHIGEGSLRFDGIEAMPVDTAKAFHGHSGILILNGLQRISDPAAAALSTHRGGLMLRSLRALSSGKGHVALAKKLASENDGVYLDKIESLSDEAALELSRHRGELHLNSLKYLENSPGHVALAKTLSKSKYRLYLDGLESIADLAAAAISQHRGGIFMRGLKSLNGSAGNVALAETLSREDGLFLDCLRALSPKAAAQICKQKNQITLGGPLRLTGEAAKELSNSKCPIHFKNLKRLSGSAANGLSQHRGFLTLDSLKEISAAAAICLGKHQGDLDLSGLTSVSNSVAQALSKHHGGLRLGSLKVLSNSREHVSLAKTLGENAYGVDLYGLTHLSAEAADKLSDHNGRITLDGLRSLSTAAAKCLSKHKGLLSLRGLVRLPEEAAKALSRHEGMIDLGAMRDSVLSHNPDLIKHLPAAENNPQPLENFDDALRSSGRVKKFLADNNLTEFDEIDDLEGVVIEHSEVVATIGAIGGEDEPFNIEIKGFGPVFWIWAPEFDDICFFGSLDQATSYAREEYGSFIRNDDSFFDEEM